MLREHLATPEHWLELFDRTATLLRPAICGADEVLAPVAGNYWRHPYVVAARRLSASLFG